MWGIYTDFDSFDRKEVREKNLAWLKKCLKNYVKFLSQF